MNFPSMDTPQLESPRVQSGVGKNGNPEGRWVLEGGENKCGFECIKPSIVRTYCARGHSANPALHHERLIGSRA